MKISIMLVVIFIAACGSLTPPTIVSADENHVTIKAGLYTNPGELASEHCSKFNKTAFLKASDDTRAGAVFYAGN